MALKDFLKKKDRVSEDDTRKSLENRNVPEFTFMRTTTTSQERINPPSFPGDSSQATTKERKHHSLFGRHSSNSPSPSHLGDDLQTKAKQERRLSERFHIGHRSRSASSSSVNVPENLPSVDHVVATNEAEEAQWEKRATMMVKGNPFATSTGSMDGPTVTGAQNGKPADSGGDENIQEAIRLHEAGDLERSTQLFGILADPKGANNALSQVLYGLALRHGWGCTPNLELAITYLSRAANNSAEVESMALSAGMTKGGAAKGELVLAIFELANCFRNGWGVKKDPFAAKQYYETAANLGDTDAMNEIAWCYLEGFGCKKDKYKAAQFLRLAEEKGNKTLGNTWIWKEKYNPKP